MEKRTFKSLKLKEKASIMSKRLLEPDLEPKEFCAKHNITNHALSTLEKMVNFDETHATNWVMQAIMEKDEELMSLSTSIKNKWAVGVSKQRTIKSRDIDTLDRIETTAMKRAALMKAAQDAEDKDETMDISITL